MRVAGNRLLLAAALLAFQGGVVYGEDVQQGHIGVGGFGHDLAIKQQMVVTDSAIPIGVGIVTRIEKLPADVHLGIQFPNYRVTLVTADGKTIVKDARNLRPEKSGPLHLGVGPFSREFSVGELILHSGSGRMVTLVKHFEGDYVLVKDVSDHSLNLVDATYLYKADPNQMINYNHEISRTAVEGAKNCSNQIKGYFLQNLADPEAEKETKSGAAK